MTTWSVCTTVAEPPDLLAAFAAHYVALGAEDVHFFLDRPTEETVELLSRLDRVSLTLCTDEYWHSVHGERPGAHLGRQRKNANLAYQQCQSDWLLFCDGDEFAVFDAPVTDLLHAVPESDLHRRLPVAERFFRQSDPQQSIFEGGFRRGLKGPKKQKVIDQVYGPLSEMLKQGLTGHVVGKSFVRTGQDLELNIHFPKPVNPTREWLDLPRPIRMGATLDGAWLLHFDGLTPLHWRLKMLRELRRYDNRVEKGEIEKGTTPTHRTRQVAAVRDGRDSLDALRTLDGLMYLTPDQEAQLAKVGGLLDITPAIADTATRAFGPALDFRPATFDSNLLAEHDELVRELRLMPR